MTGKERISRILKHQPVDRIGLYEQFWPDTYKDYVEKGKIRGDENFEEHFGLDIGTCWPFNMIMDLNFITETICEDENTVTIKDGNGAILRKHKHHDAAPEHVGFTVKTREDWDKVKHLLLEYPESRINFELYRNAKTAADKTGRFFTWCGVNVFECMHPVCGHENLLIGMASDPDWIVDMAETYAGLIIKLQGILFEKEGLPDGIWYFEDMGFKARPFFSPQMYKDMIFPGHKHTMGYAHSIELPIIVHSCGFVEPLIPGMIEAGVNCLQAIEIKAGMDLLRIYRQFGDMIALMGGIDIRKLYTNDKKAIDEELMSKIPIVKQGYGYIAHSDHSIPKTVEYEILKYYMKKVLELGTY